MLNKSMWQRGGEVALVGLLLFGVALVGVKRSPASPCPQQFADSDYCRA